MNIFAHFVLNNRGIVLLVQYMQCTYINYEYFLLLSIMIYILRQQ